MLFFGIIFLKKLWEKSLSWHRRIHHTAEKDFVSLLFSNSLRREFRELLHKHALGKSGDLFSLFVEVVWLFLSLDEFLEFSVESEISESIDLVELSRLLVLLVDLLSSQSLVELSDGSNIVSDDLVELHFVPLFLFIFLIYGFFYFFFRICKRVSRVFAKLCW